MRLAVVEQRSLAKVIEKLLPTPPNLSRIDILRVTDKPAHVRFCLHGAPTAPRIRLIADRAFIDCLLRVAVVFLVARWSRGAIDGDVVDAGPGRPDQVGIRLG